MVTCQDEKSQIKNRKKALQVLRSRLYEIERDRQHAEEAQQRRAMVRTGGSLGEDSHLQFPRGACHRPSHRLKVHQLAQVLDGDLDVLIEPLIAAQQTEALAAQAA